jgi:16S rRNA (adenine1518-N6/adenine1519-N6)-dimethyltransferase
MSAHGLLRERGLAPKKRFGQNFLVDEGLCRRIAEAATPTLGGTVVEIGPGTGALTRPLLDRAARVVAIEFDPDMVSVLRDAFASELAAERLVLHHADALSLDWATLLAGGPTPHTIAGNLPYLVTGALIERAVGLRAHVDRAVFMVQLEVAERLASRPGGDAWGALSVFTQAAFEVERLLIARAGAFWPRPGVDSAVVTLTSRETPRAVEDDALRTLVKSAFSMRRKTLRNAWRGVFGWSSDELAARAQAVGIALERRGETLSIEEFGALAALGRSHEELPEGAFDPQFDDRG